MFFNLQGFGNLVGLCFLILVFIYNSGFYNLGLLNYFAY